MAMQSVALKFKYGSADKEPLESLGEKLEEALDEAGAGDYDGYETSMDDSEGYFLFVGPDAHAIWDAIEPVASKSRILRGAEVELRMGDADDDDTETETFRVGR